MKSRLTSCTLTRNDKDRYLPEVLENLSKFVDSMIILDDCSDDGTWEWLVDCNVKHLYSNKLAIYRMDEPTFYSNELKIRKRMWDLTKEHMNPGMFREFIIINDSDEIIPEQDHYKVKEFIDDPNSVVAISDLFNMWSEDEYRVDGAWAPINSKRRLFAYRDSDEWLYERAFACGEVPKYVYDSSCRQTGIRIKHLAYSKEEDRIRKHKIYMEVDGGKYHAKWHLDSIIQQPTLEKWID